MDDRNQAGNNQGHANESGSLAAHRQKPITPFSASDIPIGEDGRIYHIQAVPGEIAPDILLVGDPGRAAFIAANFMDQITAKNEHRGLVTITGRSALSGDPTTIISPHEFTAATSGIGTPSLEIVVNELVILNEIDFATRRRKSNYDRLNIIRVGTSGGLQASTQLGMPIITTYAIGIDNTGLYYEAPFADENCERLETELYELFAGAAHPGSRFYKKLHPYVARAHPTIVAEMVAAAEHLGVPVRKGLTVSAPGFSAPQGRDISRLPPSIPDLDQIFADFDPRLEGQRIENMEMEASFLCHFLGGLGYWAGAICPAIANRRQDTFFDDYQKAIFNATRIALLALANIRKSGG